nr:hypothetical protein [uncultured Flavobacterium sp.]
MQKDLFLSERHIIPISGKDSLATALVQIAIAPDLPYEFMFNPTGAELPEVFEWLNTVENYLGKKIIRVGKDLERIIVEERNGFLPSWKDRFCTQQSKMIPMESFIGSFPAYVYYGIRADEDRPGYNGKPNIYPVYPLKTAGINLQMVYQIINNVGLKPPTFFWEEIYNRVCEHFGYDLKQKLPEWVIDILFCWRTRANCYFCFNQRLYEWIGLLEHYPELFWHAEAMEHNGSEFYWNGKNSSLKSIAERKEQIKDNLVKSIIKTIEKGRLQTSTDDEGFIDILSVTSCGLLCAK